MSDVPKARALLVKALERPVTECDFYIAKALTFMRRSRPIRKTKVQSRRITPKIKVAIKKLAKLHPTWSQQRIATTVKVNPGRVSEVLNGKR